MDELDDVSSNEKLFMKMWNCYIKTYHVISDASIPERCRGFVEAHYKELSEHNLRDHLVLHLFNLWDNSILTSSEILNLMNLYDVRIALHGDSNATDTTGRKESGKTENVLANNGTLISDEKKVSE